MKRKSLFLNHRKESRKELKRKDFSLFLSPWQSYHTYARASARACTIEPMKKKRKSRWWIQFWWWEIAISMAIKRMANDDIDAYSKSHLSSFAPLYKGNKSEIMNAKTWHTKSTFGFAAKSEISCWALMRLLTKMRISLSSN